MPSSEFYKRLQESIQAILLAVIGHEQGQNCTKFFLESALYMLCCWCDLHVPYHVCKIIVLSASDHPHSVRHFMLE